MTEPSEAAKAKARELMSAQFIGDATGLASYIQQVSDAAKVAADRATYQGGPAVGVADAVRDFILPEPVDPLVKALCGSVADPEQFAAKLRGRLALHGAQIVEASHDG